MQSEGVKFCNLKAAKMAPIFPRVHVFNMYLHSYELFYGMMRVYVASFHIVSLFYFVILDKHCFFAR